MNQVRKQYYCVMVQWQPLLSQQEGSGFEPTDFSVRSLHILYMLALWLTNGLSRMYPASHPVSAETDDDPHDPPEDKIACAK